MNSVLARLSPNQRASSRLLLISFLSLYFELMLIRWLPTEIRILAYFNNVILISCILGLGLGALVADSKHNLRGAHFYFLLALLILLTDLYHGRNIHLPLGSEGYFIWNGLSRVATGTLIQYVAMFVFFAVNMALFVPLGQILGREFDRLPPIHAYSINVAGALVGMVAFALFSLLGVPPVGWFLVGIVLLLPLLSHSMPVVLGGILVSALAVFGSFETATYWSPYYKITAFNTVVKGQIVGVQINVNEDGHQTALDLSGRLNWMPEFVSSQRVYDEPYRYGTNGDVLVVGAGTGNDVAAALRANAAHVDAVEIDPVILRLGQRVHPEHPYDDSRVTLTNKDARTFIRNSGKQYDKIVLGYLDSHSLFSAMSSVRLDNFVYTREFFEELREHLRPSGVVAVTFTVHEKWIADRLYSLFLETFGYPPVVYQGGRTTGTVFVAGEPIRNLRPRYEDYDPTQGGQTWVYDSKGEGYISPAFFSEAKIVPNDNWPYLYLRAPTIPLNYVICMIGLFVFSFATIRGTTGLGRVNWHFFFLGAAFLLVETKAITELAIFLGSTWIVNFFVISTILSLILVANFVVARGWAPSSRYCFAVLIATLAITLVAPVNALLSWDSALRDWAAVAILCLPLLFAGLIFAQQIRAEARPSAALGWNLLGALVGGILEYSSMIFGLKSLYVFAILLYTLSYFCMTRPQALPLEAPVSA